MRASSSSLVKMGEGLPLELINGETYDVISVEGNWFRIVDETGEDYLYPPESFKIIEPNDGSTSVYTIEEARALYNEES